MLLPKVPPALGHPPAPTLGPWGLHTQSPMAALLRRGARPRERAEAMAAGETEAGVVPKPDSSARRTDLKVPHARTTSALPCGHGYLLFLGTHSKEASERFSIIPLALLVPSEPYSRGQPCPHPLGIPLPQALPAAELPKEPLPQPSLTEKMQFPLLETPGRGSKVTFPMLCYSDGCKAAPRGGLVLPPPKWVQAAGAPGGSPALSDD